MSEKKSSGAPLGASELSAFCLEVYMMLKAGIPVARGLSLMGEESGRSREQTLLAGMQQAMESGGTLSEALHATGRFPGYLVRMTEIGEVSGRLEQVMEALSAYYRREAELMQNIRYAVAYPAAMVLVLSSVVFIILSRVLPMFEQAYKELGSGLSPAAEMLLRIGRAAQANALWFAGALAAVALFGFFLLFTRPGKKMVLTFAERRLGGGKLGRSLAGARFASAMALMLASGLDPEQSAAKAAELIANPAMKSRADACLAKVRDGAPFAKAAADAGLVTGMNAGLLSAGILAGDAARAMEEIAGRCEKDAAERLERAVGRVEPMLVAALSAVVALVLLSVMLPLIGVLSAAG